MRKLFRIYAAQGGHSAELELPATDHELLDLMERLRLGPGQSPYLAIQEYLEPDCSYDHLSGYIPNPPDLFRLNALAKRLAELDPHGAAAFEGFVTMDIQKGETTIPLPRLIDYAYSGDCCHVAGGVVTDAELGRFLAENGFVPETEELSNEAFELLDFARIGKNHRETEGGVLTLRGYVEQHTELREAYKTLDLSTPAPDYMILLKVSHNSNSTLLKLPASEESLAAIPQMMDEPDWQDLSLECLDCCIPTLMDAVAGTDDIAFLNCLAEKLAALEPQELTACKALLEARNCRDLASVGLLAGQLDNYNFCPEYGSPAEVAEGQLSLILGEREAGMILPHLDLEGYGKDLLQYLGGAMTPYGLLEKKDGAPLISERDHQKTNGMEMS